MALAWSCIQFPASHGSFPQVGLDMLAKEFPELQPRNRYGCPRCYTDNKPGWMRPTEAARSAAQ